MHGLWHCLNDSLTVLYSSVHLCIIPALLETFCAKVFDWLKYQEIEILRIFSTVNLLLLYLPKEGSADINWGKLQTLVVGFCSHGFAFIQNYFCDCSISITLFACLFYLTFEYLRSGVIVRSYLGTLVKTYFGGWLGVDCSSRCGLHRAADEVVLYICFFFSVSNLCRMLSTGAPAKEKMLRI